MRTYARPAGPLALCFALVLLTPAPPVRAQAGGSLSGVVLPDLPPEVSPGEEVSFTPPAGSEGGTWMLCGEVAAPEEDSEEQPAPAGASAGIRYFGVNLQDSSKGQERTSFFESRSNTATRRNATAAGYSIPLQDASGGKITGNVLITSAEGLFDEGEPPPVIVAVAMAPKAKKGSITGQGGGSASRTLRARQC